MTEFEKMQSGLVFDGYSPDILEVKDAAFKLLHKINNLPADKATPLFAQLLRVLGDNSLVTPPFLCEFGKTISVGSNTFINMGVTMLDNAPITIGNHVLIGPSVQFYTPSHPVDYRRRRKWESNCLPIVVEDDVWIGGNVAICQGVTIGARSVVAAGAVVTKDVPPDTMVAGQPAKVIKPLDYQ